MKFRLNLRLVKTAAVLLAALTLFLGAAVCVRAWEEGQRTAEQPDTDEQPPLGSGSYEEQELTYYNGASYAPKENIETILLIGVDKYLDQEESAYNNNEQGDFLMLLVLDRDAGTYSAVHLNRDTMTDIQMLGVNGKPAGTFVGQLALAHTYGSGEKDSCENEVLAVSNLLYGIDIDHYISVTLDAIPLLNDMAGGVTLEVLDDFTGIDNQLKAGKTVTLTGQHALTYVRVRKDLEDSSNIRRMERQRQYLNALQAQLKSRAKEDFVSMIKSMPELSRYIVSDCKMTDLIKLAAALNSSEAGEIHTIDGEIVEGEEYMEFYADEESLQKLVIDLFYEKAEKEN